MFWKIILILLVVAYKGKINNLLKRVELADESSNKNDNLTKVTKQLAVNLTAVLAIALYILGFIALFKVGILNF